MIQSPQESQNPLQIENFQFQSNFDLHAELQAQNENDYENLYLQEDLKLTRRHSKSTASIQLCKEVTKLTEKPSEVETIEKPTEAIIIQTKKPALQSFLKKPKKNLAQRLRIKNNAYSNMMIFFNIKKFISKIHEKVRSIQKLTAYHISLIGDKASDTQQLLINLKQKGQRRQTKSSLFNFLRMTANNSQRVYQFRLKNFALQSFEKCHKKVLKISQKIPLIQPESTEKIIWDILTALARSTLLYLVPIEIAFKPQILFNKQQMLTLLIMIILIIDLLVRLNTVCYVNGQAVRARWEIFTQQLKRTLWADTASLTPLILSFFFDKMTILNLLFYLQFGHVNKVITQTEDQLHLSRQTTQIVNLLKFIITLLFVSHIFSCIWFFSASNYNDPINWIAERGIGHQPWLTQYIDSFYYSTVTMLTIGYGDIVPLNNLEKTLAIFFMLISCIWLSYSVNTVGTIVTALTQSGEEAKRKMRLINRYMNQKNIGEYLSYCWAQENEIDLSEQRQIFEQLSNELKDELNEESHSVFLKNSPMFKNHFSLQFKRKLMPYIKQQFLQPETIFDIQFQSLENHLCFLDQGSVQIYTGNSLKSEQEFNQAGINKGATIGLQEFLTDEKPRENYKSLGFVALLTIPKSDFLEEIKDFPQDYEVYMNYRDLLIYSRANNMQTMECSACQASTHNYISCPLMHLNLDHERVIKHAKFPQEQSRSDFFSRISCRQQYHSLGDKDLVMECFELFSSERQVLIKNQARFLPHSRDSDSSNESDSLEALDKVPEPQSHLLKRLKSFEVPDLITTNFLRPSLKDLEEPLSPVKSTTKHKNKLLKRQNTTAKIAQRYKTKVEKIQTEQLILDYEQAIQQFNQLQRKNILAICKKLGDDDIPFELEILKIKVENEQQPIFSEFQESSKRFSKYMVNQNFDKVLNSIRPLDEEIALQVSHLLKYMDYPWIYMMKYKNHLKKKEKSIVKTAVPILKKRTLPKIINLKSKTIRATQIFPIKIDSMQNIE